MAIPWTARRWGDFNYECFNASQAEVLIHGVTVHPGSAKNVMVNAITVASEFEQLVPQAERPEHAEGREGFYHPIAIEGRLVRCQAHLHPA